AGHLIEDFAAETAEATVVLLEIAGPGIVLGIVSELHDAHAEVLEDLDVVELVLEGRSVLPADDNAGLVLGLGSLDIGDTADGAEDVAVFAQEMLPLRDIVDAFAEIFPEHGGDVYGSDPTGAHLLED